ncbi:YbjN domain-containing protein [Yinghuangia seranimata]|uniref:YbjN domain-containing protein n=1 Tax=Yinghuangia seranimata TaxID=408067 RepID=UPI00248A919E|nr:YbjN domain-containing protein [Yinghuangia seranimata]MDI2131773.1 YbjN domain-containing protein [Yinghuangia seranimata]
MEQTRARAAEAIRLALDDAEVTWERPDETTFVVTLPGERKLKTTCALRVGRHTLSVNAFVVRRPDENHAAFYRWMLARNVRLYGVAFSVDKLGDVYLTGRLPLHAVTAEEVDRLLGVVLETADESFNTLLELGFATSIRREWRWRTERGESTRNLDAFAHLIARDEEKDAEPAP